MILIKIVFSTMFITGIVVIYCMQLWVRDVDTMNVMDASKMFDIPSYRRMVGFAASMVAQFLIAIAAIVLSL